jgi:potassium-dependent mechanosensitive channel
LLFRQTLAAFAILLSGAFAAFAQDISAPDYDAWTGTANRAELVIDAERASDPAFETLRQQLVEWRARFQDATGLNAARIETLRAQIEALGPIPEDGTSEPAEISRQRADLTERLAEAEAPGRRAEAEMLRARGLIGEIDTLLSQRQAGALLTLEPAPLNPANWPGTAEAVYSWAQAVINENARLWASPIYRAEFGQNLPIVLIYLILGLVLLLRGWHWVGRLMAGFVAVEATSPKARLSVFFLSLIQHLAPILGVFALVEALLTTSFVGPRGTIVLDVIPRMAIFYFAAMWVGRQVFPARETAPHSLNLAPLLLRRGRVTAGGLGLLLGLTHFVDQVANTEAFETSERLVLLFPIVVLTGLLLARIGRFLLIHIRNQMAAEAMVTMRARVFGFLARAVIVLGLAAPVLVGVGYYTAGSSFLFPAALTLALLAVLGVLQRLVANFYGILTGRDQTQEESLTPMLIGFVLSLFSIPVFALIWGMRQAQLLDLWRQLIDGFDIGGITISPRNFLAFALVFAIGYTITRLVQNTLRNSVLPKTRLDAGGRTAVVTGTGYVGIFLAALIAITMVGIDLSSIAIVAGALSVGIGFGLQTVVSNFVSGIILLIERPIKEGDWIQVGTTAGYVREISVRSTRIETFDRADVIVPNADLISGVVTNMTHRNATGRVIVPVGVAYGSDTRQIETILREIAESHPMVLLTPPPSIVFQGFGADSLDFEIRAILRDVNWVLSVKSDMNHEIARRFTEAGIEIPFAQRDVWFRNPEVLSGLDAAGVAARDSATGGRKSDGENE